MSSYAATHARAKNLVAKKGAAVTFTSTTETYTASSDTLVPSSATVTGYALQDDGKTKRDGVTISGVTLFFVPSTLGDVPSPGDTVVWGGVTHTVKDVSPLAPDGTVVGATVVIE